MDAEPFAVEIADEVLEDLRVRLGRARIAGDFANADWSSGVERSYLQDLAAYWREDFDWRGQERAINAWPSGSPLRLRCPVSTSGALPTCGWS